jgi:hypothetical protein
MRPYLPFPGGGISVTNLNIIIRHSPVSWLFAKEDCFLPAKGSWCEGLIGCLDMYENLYLFKWIDKGGLMPWLEECVH